MGNNGSSSRDQRASSAGSNGFPVSESSLAGWSQSFPRELTRHRSQPPAARKVLPEPPKQRLRSTNNGSIIHNGGTISGRRVATAFPSSRDLDKQDGAFRGRSTSASNIGDPRSRRTERCCRHQVDSSRAEIAEFGPKRFGSEPDLRYSPDAGSSIHDRSSPCKSADREDGRHSSCRRIDREAKERLESRYRARKKYKAPAPPELIDRSFPIELRRDRDVSRNFASRCRLEQQQQQQQQVQPPPRRSRLFKTRAESKKAQTSWQLSSFSRPCDRDRDREPTDRHSDNEASASLVPRPDRDRVRRPNDHRHPHPHPHPHQLAQHQLRQRSKLFDGKNTLQRSMSSPEFQAELMQVARRVRDKLESSEKTVGGFQVESSMEFRSLDRRADGSFEAGRERSPIEDKTVAREAELLLGERRENRDASEPILPSEPSGEPGGERATEGGESKLNSTRDGRPPPPPSASVQEPSDRRKPLRERLEGGLDVAANRDRRRRANERRNEIPANGEAAEEGCEIRREWPRIGRVTSSETVEQGKTGDKENADPGWWNSDRRKYSTEKKWTDLVAAEKSGTKFRDSFAGEVNAMAEHRSRDDDGHAFASSTKSPPKTFYFGMNETLTRESRTSATNQQQRDQEAENSRFREEDVSVSVDAAEDTDENGRSIIEDISLKLRPTLPKKQLEIPRFSPSAAWRLLSALETPGPSMSTASEEMPVMFEERIERLSRPPPPLLALGPRSLHDKSGDSGISGDAGAAIEDSLDVSTTNRMKTAAATRPTWTPQQDLGEESSSDAGVDSPPPLPAPLKYAPRAHVFSLSLPRDDARTYLASPEANTREGSAFSSLQKLKRSVSGAFGIGAQDLRKKNSRDILDDNWLLSSSAPTSLQHSHAIEASRTSSSAWKPFSSMELADDDDHRDVDGDEDGGDGDIDDDDDGDDEDDGGAADAEDEDEDGDVADVDDDDNDDGVEDDEEEVEVLESKGDFPVIMKPPSFSYLAPGGHVMYLPESSETEHRVRSLNGRRANENCEKSSAKEGGKPSESRCSRLKDDRDESTSTKQQRAKHPRRSGSRENADGKQRKGNFSSPLDDRESSMLDEQTFSERKEVKSQGKSSSKGRRFTFQSTVRQIERRRLAEKLSREAEAKERQRKGELEAMRKVEEEFQRKRAKEKANIRQQLRLFKEMEENFNSLPVEWDGSQISRADPDGAPSSTASSPTSLPVGKVPDKAFAAEEFQWKRVTGSESKHRREDQTSCRPKYYDWAPDTFSHLEYKQTTVHPQIICDIPKSSPVFVNANVHPAKPVTSACTPRSDNYRKDFVHGAMVARSSFASSDSELSQPSARPLSKQTGTKAKTHRSGSASPERSEDAASSGEDAPVEAVKRPRNPTHDFILNGLQPFMKEKTYRPISFNPQPPPPIPS